MRKNLTELVFILDKSGSMYSRTADTIGGFNSMIAEQKAEEGQALVTTILFSDGLQTLHDRKDLQEITELTTRDYVASGSTALYDAIGYAIDHIKNIHKYAREEDRPEKTLFVITTDGMENASKRYSLSDVHSLIKEREECGWQFVFVAANIDAVETGASMGVDERYCSNYAVGDELHMYRAMSAMVSDYRRGPVPPTRRKHKDISPDKK